MSAYNFRNPVLLDACEKIDHAILQQSQSRWQSDAMYFFNILLFMVLVSLSKLALPKSRLIIFGAIIYVLGILLP